MKKRAFSAIIATSLLLNISPAFAAGEELDPTGTEVPASAETKENQVSPNNEQMPEITGTAVEEPSGDNQPQQDKAHVTDMPKAPKITKSQQKPDNALKKSAAVQNWQTFKTSKLGHIRSKNVKIYQQPGSEKGAVKAGTAHTNQVYYIKKEGSLNGQIYYLLSTRPSAKTGVIGWVKAADVTAREHTVVDKTAKTLFLTGKGKAYDTIWGGKKNLDPVDLSASKLAVFSVHLTEKAGETTWYRGNLNGKSVWVEARYTAAEKPGSIEKHEVSKLGQIQSAETLIYKEPGDAATAAAAGTLTGQTFAIREEGKLNGEIYSRLSKADGTIVGWAKSAQLEVRSYASAGTSSVFVVKGTGTAYDVAWGSAGNIVMADLTAYANQEFTAVGKEIVGKDIWYKGDLDGKSVSIQASDLVPFEKTEQSYGITLNEALSMQMKASPQTDKNVQYVHSSFVTFNGKDYVVNTDALNVRSGPGTGYAVVGQLSKGKKLSIKKKTGEWYQLFWTDAARADVEKQLNPLNFLNDPIQRFQFLDLSKASSATAETLNRYLAGKGILEGKGAAFVEAANQNNVNDAYLISHALLETGNGSSTLANGIPVNASGAVTRDASGKLAKTEQTQYYVYNMYGYGARDACPIDCGAKYAFDNGWYTPEAAIIGGAADVGKKYINAGQNTLYKMRWNPAYMETKNQAGYQYATDIGWASKQVSRMYQLYQDIGSYVMRLEIPVYKKE